MPPTDLFFVVTGARQVFMAKEMETKEIVAVKKIRMDNERDDVSIPLLAFGNTYRFTALISLEFGASSLSRPSGRLKSSRSCITRTSSISKRSSPCQV